jgi:D-beta-D-heptose 7-phosphate kinase/D-beta-D-heptose 1-phosphate adenosyltransferase
MKILVIGDVMLDINYISKVERSAPEANIPIYNIQDVNYILGGAANVANNLKSLGTDVEVELVSVIGKDSCGNKINSILDERGIKHKLFVDEERKTTQKNRIFQNSKIAVRYDMEDTKDVGQIIIDEIYYYIIQMQYLDAVIISDYDKGVVTYSLCQKIIDYCNKQNIFTFIDPKLKNYKKYNGCFCFKPNRSESEKISQSTEFDYIFNFIKKNINCKHTVITSSENGIYLNSKKNQITHENSIKLVDVTGAGDVVLTVLAYTFIKYGDMLLSCNIANYIAGKSVEVVGNYTIHENDIHEYYDRLQISKINKVIYETETDKLKFFQNKNVVFTNGCFDILHSAHLKLLNFSRGHGDILIVGINSDSSIKKIKGEKRPINELSERVEILSQLKIIDYIIVFDSNTPYEILKCIQPNVIVKGGDYTKETVIGGEFAKKIFLFDYIQNKSTSLVIEKITRSTLE